jgi:hypothetical protein
MFVQARFSMPSAPHTLTVPRSAVLDTGARKLVYVAKGNDVFEAQEVQLGPAGDDYYPVVAGLKGGERVVTEGNFLVDSQTRIAGAMSGMFGGSKEFSTEQAPATSEKWKVSLRTNPATPQGGDKAALHVSVEDAAGRSVPDAAVNVTLFMPAMPAMGMAEMREATTVEWKGSDYQGAIRVPTAGTWTVTVEVMREGRVVANYRTTLNAK